MPEDEANGAGVDSDVLARIGRRLDGSRRFDRIAYRPPYAPSSIVADYDLGYFPAAVERAYLRVEWFESDDFHIHYSEQYGDGRSWECRWDRHPNDHNARAHFHPPPDAATPGTDASYSSDWRDIMTRVLDALDEHVKSFWESSTHD